MFNYEIKFLSYDDVSQVKNGDFKTFKYETKKKSEETIYDVGKRSYCEKRGGHWRAQRPRQLRQLEVKLRDRGVVSCDWASESLITIVFSNGAIAYLTIKPETLDVIQILFDRYCIGKLSGQVTGVVMCKTHLLFTYADRVATLISFGKQTSVLPSRITDRDPHIQTIEIGGSSRRAERKVSWCERGLGVHVLVWSATTADPAPWSPAVEDLANLHLYQIHGQQINLMVYHQLENETLSAELSNSGDHCIHIVEQLASNKTGINLNWLQYETPNYEDRAIKLSMANVNATRVRLPAPARCVRRSRDDSRLLASCIDGTLHVIHQAAGVMHSTRAGFIGTDVRWAGEVVVAAEEGGRLQCFDRALSQLLNHHTKCLDLATYLKSERDNRVTAVCLYAFVNPYVAIPYFLHTPLNTFAAGRESRRMQILASKDLAGGAMLLTAFAGGPLALLRITHPKLLTAWIRSGRAANAVLLLRAMDWETEGGECLRALTAIVGLALRARLQGPNGEGLAQAALGAFLAPARPLSAPAARFAPHVHDLARKFFHHLLRRGRVEKALSLAVDLRARDLFGDARWAARARALPALADEAAALAAVCADAYTESECSDSCSQCSSSCSGSEADTTASSEANKERSRLPPLPRVAHPPAPPRPSAPAMTPAPAPSLRPSLHHYFERDNTIWNSDDRNDTQIKPNVYTEHIKPILISQNTKWASVDNVLSYKTGTKQNQAGSEMRSTNSIIDIIPRQDERFTAAHFRHLLQTDLREELPNTLYRYHDVSVGVSGNDRGHRQTIQVPERSANRTCERNKVKFSDTVTVNVVPEHARSHTHSCPEPARELADSLPLSPPHSYLAAFAPAPQPPPPPPPPPPSGTPRDYVEV